MVPLILCQTLNIAPGIVASGNVAKCNTAKLEANPEFCIPTSMLIAAHFLA